MSDKDIDEAPVAEEQVEEKQAADKMIDENRAPGEEQPVEQKSVEKPATKRGAAPIAWLSFLVAIIALTLAGYMGWQDWRAADDTAADERIAGLDDRLSASASSIDELAARIDELGRREPDVDAADLDAVRQELDERIRLLSSLPARIASLESSVAALAGVSEGARDAWILAESEYYMQIANAQLQLANNPHLAALALRMADERIVQLSNPALTEVRRAISDELAALEIMEKPDIEGATLTLSSLARVVEALPLAGAVDDTEESGEIDPELSGAGRAWASVKNAMSGLVKVTPPERARVVALSPDGEFFLRNNIALQLQAARLALLRGEQAIFESTLDDTSALLQEYFDTSSTQVAGALDTIAEVRSHVFTTDAPDISESLRLLRQFRSLNENAQ